MKLRLTIAAVLVLIAGSASARTETFSADSSDAADGKCRLSGVASGTLKIHGTFGGGTATVRALAEGGNVATAADWVAVSTYTTDIGKYYLHKVGDSSVASFDHCVTSPVTQAPRL